MICHLIAHHLIYQYFTALYGYRPLSQQTSVTLLSNYICTPVSQFIWSVDLCKKHVFCLLQIFTLYQCLSRNRTIYILLAVLHHCVLLVLLVCYCYYWINRFADHNWLILLLTGWMNAETDTARPQPFKLSRQKHGRRGLVWGSSCSWSPLCADGQKAKSSPR